MVAVFTHPDRHRVAVLVRDGVLPIEAGSVHRLFGQARDTSGNPLYEVITCALAPGEVRTDTDFSLNVRHGPEALGTADTVVLPAADEDYVERPHDPWTQRSPKRSRVSARTRGWPPSAPGRSYSLPPDY